MAVLLLLLDISVLPLVVVVVADDFVPVTATTVGSGLDNAEAVVLCNSVENNPILFDLLFFGCGGGLLIVSKRPIGYCKYMVVGLVLCYRCLYHAPTERVFWLLLSMSMLFLSHGYLSTRDRSIAANELSYRY